MTLEICNYDVYFITYDVTSLDEFHEMHIVVNSIVMNPIDAENESHGVSLANERRKLCFRVCVTQWSVLSSYHIISVNH